MDPLLILPAIIVVGYFVFGLTLLVLAAIRKNATEFAARLDRELFDDRRAR